MAKPGRPEYTEEDYQKWLDEMAPFLKLGTSLYDAMQCAGIISHKNRVYQKYKLNDWFCEKVDAYRAQPGIMINNIMTKYVINVDTKIKQGLPVSEDEMKNVRFMAEKHRTAQPFFVTRTETAESDANQVGKILDNIEQTDYATVGQEASKQVVAANAPVQDKE